MPPTEQPFVISTYCHSGGCVAVALDSREVFVRSSREVDGPVLSFPPGRWTAFVDGLGSTTTATAHHR